MGALVSKDYYRSFIPLLKEKVKVFHSHEKNAKNLAFFIIYCIIKPETNTKTTMKNRFSLLVVAVLSTFTTNFTFSQVVFYNFDEACNNTGCADNCHGEGVPSWSFLNTFFIASASDFDLGPGLGSSSFVCGGSPMNGFAAGSPSNPSRARWANGWPTTNLVNPNSDYFSFILTTQPFSNVQLTAITWQEQRSSSGPIGRELRMSHDGFTTSFPISVTAGTWNTMTVNTGLPSFYNGSIEIRIYGHSASSSAGSLRIDNVRVYANITNLPIELVSFEGKKSGNSVKIDWSTASEHNNEYFTVFRSSNGTDFGEVGRVPSRGDSQNPTEYELFDPSPRDGVNYYRLRQTDFDGTFVDSHTIAVEFTRVENVVHRVGDTVQIAGQKSYLVNQLGQILDLATEHHMTQIGIYFLQGEDGSVKRVSVTPY